MNRQFFELPTVVAPKMSSLSRRSIECPLMFLLGMLDKSWSHLAAGSLVRISLSPVSEMTMCYVTEV